MSTFYAVKGHDCELDEFQAKESSSTWKKRIKEGCHDLILASMNNARLLLILRSYGGILAEKKRQLKNPRYRYVIHPYSQLRVIWQMLMLVVYLVSYAFIPLRDTFTEKGKMMKPVSRYTGPFELQLLLAMNIMCAIDIFMNFKSGYRDKHTDEIVLDRARICRNYLRGYFIIDVLHTIPAQFTVALLYAEQQQEYGVEGSPYLKYAKYALYMAIFRAARMITCLDLVTQFCEICRMSPTKGRIVRTAIIFFCFVHWSACTMYYVPFTAHGKFLVYDVEPFPTLFATSWIHRFKIATNSYSYRYTASAYMVTSIITAVGFCEPIVDFMLEDLILESILSLFSLPINAYLFMTFFHIAANTDQAAVKYVNVMNQLQEFMRVKQLPIELQERFLAYYDYRYDEKFFNEHTIMSSLSEAMRNEIDMYTCRRLIECVAIFYFLPRDVILSIVSRLHLEVSLPNDVIISAGTTGDCMYFLASGTVAVMMSTGKEICHLVDGAHFGEVCLLHEDHKRIASVVAVEPCEVFRLDRVDFERCVDVCPNLREMMTALANERAEYAYLLDAAVREKMMEDPNVTFTAFDENPPQDTTGRFGRRKANKK